MKHCEIYVFSHIENFIKENNVDKSKDCISVEEYKIPNMYKSDFEYITLIGYLKKSKYVYFTTSSGTKYK